MREKLGGFGRLEGWKLANPPIPRTEPRDEVFQPSKDIQFLNCVSPIKVKDRFVRFFLIPILLLVLSNCGDTQPANRPDFQPIRPDPTSTLAASPLGTPTSVVSDQVELSSYTHFTQRFSLSYPANWQFFERPDGVVFIDPGDQAGYSVFFSDVGQTYSEQELNQYLVTFVAKNFAEKEADFTPLSQEQKADGSIVAQFASVDPKLGQAMNEVHVSQKDTIVYVIFISATEEQWQVSQNQFHRLADTLTPLDTSPVVEIPPTDEPPVWLLTGPTSNAFGFLYPSDWKIARQDESSVAVTMPDTNITFEASVSDASGAKDDPKAAEKVALKYVENLGKENKDLQSLPPAKFQLDQITDAVTIDFLYTAADGTQMAGSIITAFSEGKMYQVVFTSSAELYEFALQWFNSMYMSFKILPAEDIIKEP